MLFLRLEKIDVETLSRHRWVLMAVGLLPTVSFAVDRYADEILVFGGAIAALCLGLSAWSARAKGWSWSSLLSALAAVAWIACVVGMIWGAASGPSGIVPGLLLVLPGMAAGTVLSALALGAFLWEARA